LFKTSRLDQTILKLYQHQHGFQTHTVFNKRFGEQLLFHVRQAIETCFLKYGTE